MQSEGKRKPEPDSRFYSSMTWKGNFTFQPPLIHHSHSMVPVGFGVRS